jgi:translation initiation factor IF-3
MPGNRSNRSHKKGPAIARDLRVNQMIRIPQVRVVDEEGAQLGVMPTPRALEMAQERGYDLVEVAPMASPPVVKFLDFGQYKYELTKREKENKRRQRSVTFKEIRLSPKIGVGDFETKIHRAVEFLEEGDRIKVTVRFRGRELTHPELGRNMLARFTDQIKDHGVVERAPLLEGKSMHVTVASLHKPKSHDAAAGAPKGDQAETAAASTEPAAAPAAAATTSTPPTPAPAAAATPPAATPAAAATPAPASDAPATTATAEPAATTAAPAEDAAKPAPKPAATRTKTAAPKAAAANGTAPAAAAPARTRTTTAKPAETPVTTGE